MTKDFEYTKSIIDRLEKVNASLEKATSSGNSSDDLNSSDLEGYMLSTWEGEDTKDTFIEWDRVQDAVLPAHLKYLSGLSFKKHVNRLGKVSFN